MRYRLLTVVTGILLLLAGLAVAAWLFSPRLIRVVPAADASHVPADAVLKMEFSQVLTLESVREFLDIVPQQPGTYSWEGKTLVFTPSQPWPRGEVIHITLRWGVRAAIFPGLPVLQTSTWQFKISRPRLAYLWPSDGPADIYALEPETGDIQRITIDQNILDYALSLDGNWIYFSADDGQGGSQIARVDLAQIPGLQTGQFLPTEPLIHCIQASCRLAQPSPDGRWIAYERASLQSVGSPEQSSVWIFSLEARRSHQISEGDHTASSPVWSPSGLMAFYDQDLQAYQIFHPERGFTGSLPNQTGDRGTWQPDGRAFVALEVLIESTGLLDPHGTSHLIRYELDRTGAILEAQTDLSQAFDREDNDPVFSPDGTKLAFSRRYLDPVRWTPGRQLWVMHADGSQAQPLTKEPSFHHYGFAWRPDGFQIAIIRFDPTLLTHPPELWLMDVDGSNPVQLVIGGFAPKWIP